MNSNYSKKREISQRFEDSFEHAKWVGQIPYINFKKEWKVKVIPAFGGAVVRFIVSFKEAEISVYLDCYDMLGRYGSPYWELYPHDEDVFRCDINDTKSLLQAIEYSLNKQNEKDMITKEQLEQNVINCNHEKAHEQEVRNFLTEKTKDSIYNWLNDLSIEGYTGVRFPLGNDSRILFFKNAIDEIVKDSGGGLSYQFVWYRKYSHMFLIDNRLYIYELFENWRKKALKESEYSYEEYKYLI